MSRLRILEEERRLPKSMPFDERREIKEFLRRRLYEHREMLLAVVHGGFLRSIIFRDVDVAVYTGYRINYDEEPVYIDELREEMEKEVKLPIDIQLLDYAPPTFKLTALKGELLFEKIDGLRAILRFHAAEELNALRV
jgi:hypothetical protein